jgi:hypothetical protein
VVDGAAVVSQIMPLIILIVVVPVHSPELARGESGFSKVASFDDGHMLHSIARLIGTLGGHPLEALAVPVVTGVLAVCVRVVSIMVTMGGSGSTLLLPSELVKVWSLSFRLMPQAIAL